MSRLFALAVFCALLAACAAQIPVDEQDAGITSEPTVKVPERAFPNDSFYALLVAEFALRRQAYDVMLGNYMEQATLLRDPGVSAHTTHLSQFLQREEEALQSAQLWAELDPENPEANNTLAGLLTQKGRTVDALPYLVVVERKTGSANFPMLLNGFGQLNEAQRTQLTAEIDKLAIEFPRNTALLLTQALIDSELRQFDQALDHLDMIFELEPAQPQAVLLEARILVEQKAKDPYARLQQVLQENPDSTLLRLQYARLLTVTDMVAAREQFEILLEQAPDDGDLLFSLALINHEIGDRDAARTYLQLVIASGQRQNEAYYYLGRIADDASDPNAALANYMQVGEGQEYLAATSRIGQILVADGQLDRSQAWFKQQREEFPQLRDQLYSLESDILAQSGESDRAMQLLDQAVAESPDNTSVRYVRAMLSEQEDDLVSMEKDLRIILAADPDNSTALNALGYTLADRTARLQEALELITRALQLRPDEPAILDSMGWVQFRLGQNEDATAYLTRAYAQFPDPEVAAHLIEVLWVKGDIAAAKSIGQGALLRDPSHPKLLDTMKRLGMDLPVIAPIKDSPPKSRP